MGNNKLLQMISTYLKGVKAEWGKITWPEKNQVVVETVFVLVIVISFTLFIYVIDLIFKYGVEWIVNIIK